MSLYSPLGSLLLGIAKNNDSFPSIIFMSWSTNSLSKVTDTIALSFPSVGNLRSLTSVMFIEVSSSLSLSHYNTNKLYIEYIS